MHIRAWLVRLAALLAPLVTCAPAFHLEASPPGVSDAASSDRLAIVVPAYRGDLDRAVASLERWPIVCSSITERNVDLVLYYAEGDEDNSSVAAAGEAITSSAGRCFANTRIVYAYLAPEVRGSARARIMHLQACRLLIVCCLSLLIQRPR